MLASIIIPWHRNLEDLSRAVASVLAQDWPELELIVVANGVDDAQFAAASAVSTDPRLRVERRPQPSASAARNHGMTLAQGALLFFLDADDVFLPGKLAAFAAAYRETPFDLGFSRGWRDRGDGREWPMPPQLWDGSLSIAEFFFVVPGNISTSALVLSATAAKILRFDAAASPYEDPDLVIRAADAGLRLRMLPETLYRWSDHSNAGRLSRQLNVEQRLAWIDALPVSVSKRARAAFRARCVAQHLFPQRPLLSLRLLAQAAWHRAVPLHELGLFMLRGLLPAGLRQHLLDLYLQGKAKRAATP